LLQKKTAMKRSSISSISNIKMNDNNTSLQNQNQMQEEDEHTRTDISDKDDYSEVTQENKHETQPEGTNANAPKEHKFKQ